MWGFISNAVTPDDRVMAAGISGRTAAAAGADGRGRDAGAGAAGGAPVRRPGPAELADDVPGHAPAAGPAAAAAAVATPTAAADAPADDTAGGAYCYFASVLE